MKKFKTIKWQVSIALVGFIIIYFAFAVWVSTDMKKTVREVVLSEETFGSIYEEKISDDAYNSFFRREIYGSYEGDGVEIQLHLSNPIPVHYFFGGYIWMTYA